VTLRPSSKNVSTARMFHDVCPKILFLWNSEGGLPPAFPLSPTPMPVAPELRGYNAYSRRQLVLTTIC